MYKTFHQHLGYGKKSDGLKFMTLLVLRLQDWGFPRELYLVK